MSNSSTNKGIKTSVRLDVKDAEKKLKKLENRISSINKLVNSSGVSLNKLTASLNRVDTTNKRVANSAKQISKGYRDANSAVSILTKNVRTLASTYLGVMGAKAVTGASDTITSTENRLNALNGNNHTQTQSDMNKMYASAQKVRMGYADMAQNVSKSMTLAGDAFQGNIDNAIRFQEIMAEAYTLGGASAAEQASSMYQMIQALGAGVLQGDELRSVREGAPIAYKKIEEFAQGVYNTEESLKDLASQGMITSEIVVAAMMQAGEGIDKAFANTEMTFAQAFTRMRNMALQSFKPVLQTLNDALGSTAGQAIMNGIGTALYVVAQSLLVVFGWIEKIYNFVASNWGTIVRTMLTIAELIYVIGIGIAVTLLPNIIAAGKAALIGLAKTIVSLSQTIYLMGLYIAEWLALHWVLAIILVALAAVVIAIIWVADSFVDACGIIAGTALGLVEVFKALGTNIALIFGYAWDSAKSAFWTFVKECLEGIKFLEPAINAVAEAFGKKGFTLSGVIKTVSGKAKAPSTPNLVSVSDAWNKGYNGGYDWGTNKANGLTNWLSDKFGMSGLDSIINPTSSVGGGYNPAQALEDIAKGVGDTSDNTGKMADSMELTKEDLEYLRRVADMEWKKEFTTANITVDMSNYNTISGDGDLDGIVTRLSDKLYEELTMVANGVYA